MKNLKTVLSLSLLFSSISSSVALADTNCLFGEELSLDSTSRLSISSKGFKTLKVPRSGRDSGTDPVAVEVYNVRDKQTKREYQINLTFRHADDGDNAWGWIEDTTAAFPDNGKRFPEVGQVVATIGDLSIYNCTVRK